MNLSRAECDIAVVPLSFDLVILSDVPLELSLDQPVVISNPFFGKVNFTKVIDNPTFGTDKISPTEVLAESPERPRSAGPTEQTLVLTFGTGPSTDVYTTPNENRLMLKSATQCNGYFQFSDGHKRRCHNRRVAAPGSDGVVYCHLHEHANTILS